MKLTDIIHSVGDRVRLSSRVTALTGGTRAVDSVVVTNGGTGYSSSFAVTFSGGGGSGAAGTATAVSGIVRSVAITNPGTGYTSAPSPVFTAGGGSSATGTSIMLALTLDAIVTASISLTINPTFPVFVLIGGMISVYRLRAGTDAESSPFIIRPDDYAASTNEKVWELCGSMDLREASAVKTLTYAASVALDFDTFGVQTVDLTGDITFTTSNRGTGKRLLVKIKSDGSLRNFTFPSWVSMGAALPASIAANKTALLKLTGFGTADTDIVAEYSVEP